MFYSFKISKEQIANFSRRGYYYQFDFNGQSVPKSNYNRDLAFN